MTRMAATNPADAANRWETCAEMPTFAVHLAGIKMPITCPAMAAKVP